MQRTEQRTDLTDLDVELLEQMAVEPTGLSLAEYADGLFGRRDPASLGRVRRSLGRIEAVLGGLWFGRGDDAFGHYDVPVVAMRRCDRTKAARLANRLAGRA